MFKPKTHANIHMHLSTLQTTKYRAMDCERESLLITSHVYKSLKLLSDSETLKIM